MEDRHHTACQIWQVTFARSNYDDTRVCRQGPETLGKGLEYLFILDNLLTDCMQCISMDI